MRGSTSPRPRARSWGVRAAGRTHGWDLLGGRPASAARSRKPLQRPARLVALGAATLLAASFLAALPAGAISSFGIGSNSEISFINSQAWAFGVDTNVTFGGSLLEVDGNVTVPIADAPVTVTINGQPLPASSVTSTDSQGVFSASTRFAAAGHYSIGASFSPSSDSVCRQSGAPHWCLDKGSATTVLAPVANVGFEVPFSVSVWRAQVTRGTATLSGAVTVNGTGRGGALVSLTLDNSGKVSSIQTNPDGSFSFSLPFAAPDTPGTHLARLSTAVKDGPLYTLTQDVIVHVRENITAQLAGLPAHGPWPFGLLLPLSCVATDGSGQAVGAIPLNLSILPANNGTNELGGTVSTDAHGSASFPFGAPSPGRYSAQCQGAANDPDTVVATTLRIGFTVGSPTAKWATSAPSVLRGHSNVSRFWVLVGNETLSNWSAGAAPYRPLLAFPPASFASVSENPNLDGSWDVTLSVPATQPSASEQLSLELAPVGFASASASMPTLPWSIVSQTSLKANASVTSKGVLVSFRAVDESGLPVEGVPIEATLSTHAWSKNVTQATDPNGYFNWSLPASSLPHGPYNLVATAQATPNSLASAPLTETIQTVKTTGAPNPWLSFVNLAGLAAVTVLVAAGGAYWFVRTRRVPAAAAPAALTVAATRVLGTKGTPSVDLSIAEIEPDLPPVWGAGEPFTLQVRAERPPPPAAKAIAPRAGSANAAEGPAGGDDGAPTEQKPAPLENARVLIETPAGREEARLDEAGRCSVALRGPKGEFPIHLRIEPDAADGLGPATVTFPIRLVSYQDEIGREFDGVVERGTLLAPKLGRSTTPRELQWALQEKFSSGALPALEELASVVERSNYAPAEVGRAEYVRMVRARMTLDGYLPAGGTNPTKPATTSAWATEAP